MCSLSRVRSARCNRLASVWVSRVDSICCMACCNWSSVTRPVREEMVVPKGPARMNTLWGVCIREHAKMCVPDIDVFKNYPIDYRFPAFGKDRNGQVVGSGFFPADPIALHTNSFVGVNR